jgi:hypothetical protein
MAVNKYNILSKAETCGGVYSIPLEFKIMMEVRQS